MEPFEVLSDYRFLDSRPPIRDIEKDMDDPRVGADGDCLLVGGLIADPAVSIFILPTLHVRFASDGDALSEAEANLET
jgi:hypothetical protein